MTPDIQILAAGNILGLPLERLNADETGRIRGAVISRYCRNVPHAFLWETFAVPESLHDPDGWMRLSKWKGGTELILFFDEHDSKNSILCPPGTPIESLISESTGFEFYITSPAVDFVICFNHHDCLIGIGKATDWIKQQRIAI